MKKKKKPSVKRSSATNKRTARPPKSGKKSPDPRTTTKKKPPAPQTKVRRPISLAEFQAGIAAALAAPATDRFRAIDALDHAVRDVVEPDGMAAQNAVNAAERSLLARALHDPDLAKPLAVAARETPWKVERINALGDLDNDDVFSVVRDEAVRQLGLEYYDTKPAWLFALGALGRRARFADEVREIVAGGFKRVVESRKNLVNAVAFGALANAAARLAPHPAIGPALHHAFRVAAGQTDVRAHYDLNVSCGPIAVALAAVGYREASGDLRTFANSDQYEGDAFLVQVRYALWLLAHDGAAVLVYLNDPEHKKSLGLVAAALADLDHKPARAALVEREPALAHAVAKEAFAEAIARLTKQVGPPVVPDRMIWLFGRKSPTEQALGEDSDNVFVQRAIERTKNPELGMVYEVDDSAPED